jgi:hypothetical protein
MSRRFRSRAVVVFAIVVFASCYLSSLAQISPGKLSAPHAELEGSLNCMKCHDAERGVSPRLCLECHQPLQRQISQGKGLHARREYADCRKCHMEHSGREFELIWWGDAGRTALDHRLTGYTLEGAHGKLDCEKCHRAKNIRDRGPLVAQGKDLSRTFLGLDSGCLSCHTDEHAGQYEQTECLSCHSMDSWKPANRFDHSTTKYPLLGRHLNVACTKCHLPEGGDPEKVKPSELRFRGVAFERCTDCHRDEHRGQFTTERCSSCHKVDGWMTTSFDHARSAYPLTGSHRQVECRRCHLAVADPKSTTGETYRLLRGVNHGSCTDCHEDKHAGRLGPNCVECHDTNGWKSKPGTEFDHARTRYPLEGKHADVRCEQCHPPGAPLTVAGFERCASCHRDTHLGQFAEREDLGACEACHKVASFRPSSFTLAEHQRGSFRLEGAHGAIPCDQCHVRVEPRTLLPSTTATEPTMRFSFRSALCVDCHDDPHRGKLDRYMKDGGCENCHSVQNWTRIVFDHDQTRFRLEPAHVKPACGQCHRRGEADSADALVWTGFGERCVDCHPDPHLGQFDRAGGPKICTDCHQSTTWRSLLFVHDRDSTFQLKGAHARVGCEKCHLAEGSGEARMIRYRPLQTKCVSCHDSPRRLQEAPR